MLEHATLLHSDPSSPSAQWNSATLPPDLLEQVRGRVRLLALFFLAASAFDPLLYFGAWGVTALRGHEPPSDFLARLPFQWINLAAAAASAGLWWIARNRRVSPARLLTVGLAYEVVICFVIAIGTIWEYYITDHLLPYMTWVPVIVVIFPLIMPAPPGRTLVAAVAAAAMTPVAILALDLSGEVSTDANAYVRATVHATFAVAFAYLGARIVYGLGRQVAEARELGSYRLETRLGEGGMGEVWRARHRMLARPAAVKLIRSSGAGGAPLALSPVARQRFEHEAQVIARLRSPHTVELFDFGIAQDGAFYYAMELLDGLDADALVRRFGPVPAERAVYLLRQVCHSLSEAGSYGLVHRDIKPANIFLCRYGEEYDFVKVLDFGLVKALDRPEASGPPLTREQTVQGTPAFIAPEQAMGDSDLDSRVDIYATGCVAYWLLTGQLVFTAATPTGLLLHHAHTPPTPPSSRTDRPIPEALDRLVLSCLAKNPADRPQSAKELSARLSDVAGTTAWTEERARDWWTTHRPVGASADG